MDFLALGIAIILFVIGVAGIVMPLLPGTVLIFVGMLVYGLMTGFETLDIWFFVFQGLATILTYFIDHIAAVIGTRRYGGSKKAVLGAFLGIALGIVVLGPLGLIIGAFLGALAGELISGKPFDQALRTGTGVLIGFIGSALIKVLISIAMITWFFIRIF